MAALKSAGISLRELLSEEAEVAVDVLVSGLVLDSRAVSPGDLFLAVQGSSQDGRQYIPQAIAAGCVAVVAEARQFHQLFPRQGTVVKALEKSGIPLVLVDDLQARISNIAAVFYGKPGLGMEVFGVTGTNGKTTCSLLIAQMAALLQQQAGVIGTLGWGVQVEDGIQLTETGMTTPDAVALQQILAALRDQKIATVAMEVSSHSLDQSRVSAAGIDCAIFTNLSRDHLDYHGSEEEYGAAKARLFTLPSVSRAVINVDDAFGAQLLRLVAPAVEVVTYGLSAHAQVRATDIRLSDAGISFSIQSPWGSGMVSSPLLGGFNILNLLAVIAAFAQQHRQLDSILSLVPRLQPVPGRMEIYKARGCPTVVVDYAHSPDALEKALSALREHCRQELWCVFGCGGDRDQGKRPQMGAIAERLADHVIVTSDNPRSEAPELIARQIVGGMLRPDQVRVELNRRLAIEQVIAQAAVGDCVLIAGKGHEEYQQIGAEKLPFSDRGMAEEVLAIRAAQYAGGDQ